MAFKAAAVGFYYLMHPFGMGINHGLQFVDVLGGDGYVFADIELAGDLVEITADAQ